MTADAKRVPDIVEPTVIPDIVATELVAVEIIGPFARLIFAMPSTMSSFNEGAGALREVVAKIIIPADAIQEAAQKLARSGPARVMYEGPGGRKRTRAVDLTCVGKC